MANEEKPFSRFLETVTHVTVFPLRELTEKFAEKRAQRMPKHSGIIPQGSSSHIDRLVEMRVREWMMRMKPTGITPAKNEITPERNKIPKP